MEIRAYIGWDATRYEKNRMIMCTTGGREALGVFKD
jgi:hypothetical protein